MAFWKKKKQDRTASPVTAPNPSTSNLNEIVLQSIHEGVAFIGQDGNVRLANPSAVRLLGRGLDEILGLNYDSVLIAFHLVDTIRRVLAHSFAGVTYGHGIIARLNAFEIDFEIFFGYKRNVIFVVIGGRAVGSSVNSENTEVGCLTRPYKIIGFAAKLS